MGASLLSLPAELLGAIAWHLGVRDAVRLAQTCHGLHSHRSELLRNCNPLSEAVAPGRLSFLELHTHTAFPALPSTEAALMGPFRDKVPLADAVLLNRSLQARNTPKAKLIHWAVITNHVSLVRDTIEREGITAADVCGVHCWTLRHAADTSSGLDMVRLLCTELGLTAADVLGARGMLLHGVCAKGRLEILRFFVEEVGVGAAAVFDFKGWSCSPFLGACEQGQVEVVRYVIEHFNMDCAGVVNACRIENLIGAASAGGLPMLKYLMEEVGIAAFVAGFEEQLVHSIGFPSLCFSNSMDVLRYLAGIGMGLALDPERDLTLLSECFLEACRGGHVEVAEFLLDNLKLPISEARDARDFGCEGFGPFALACESGSLAMVRFLMEEVGLTVEHLQLTAGEEDNEIADGVQLACCHGSLDLVQYLLEVVNVLGDCCLEDVEEVLQEGQSNANSELQSSASAARRAEIVTVIAYVERKLQEVAEVHI